MRISLKKGRQMKLWEQKLEKASDVIDRNVSNVLEYGAEKVIEHARQNLGNNTKGRGLLAQSLWRNAPKRGKRGEWVVEVGWGYYYGRVLEFGPKHVRVWHIRAKPEKSSRNPKYWKALRISFPGAVIYRRHVIQYWNASRLRPHYEPAIKKAWPEVRQKLSEVMAQSLIGK